MPAATTPTAAMVMPTDFVHLVGVGRTLGATLGFPSTPRGASAGDVSARASSFSRAYSVTPGEGCRETSSGRSREVRLSTAMRTRCTPTGRRRRSGRLEVRGTGSPSTRILISGRSASTSTSPTHSWPIISLQASDSAQTCTSGAVCEAMTWSLSPSTFSPRVSTSLTRKMRPFSVLVRSPAMTSSTPCSPPRLARHGTLSPQPCFSAGSGSATTDRYRFDASATWRNASSTAFSSGSVSPLRTRRYNPSVVPSPFGFAAGSDGCVPGSGGADCALGAAGAAAAGAGGGGGGSSCCCLGFDFALRDDWATAGIEAIETTTSAATSRCMRASPVPAITPALLDEQATGRRRSAALPSDCDQIDLHARAFRQGGDLHGRARRRRSGEALPVDLVHRREIVQIGEEDARLHHVGEAHPRSGEHGGEVLHHPLGLRAHVALHHLLRLRIERDLAAGEDQIAGHDRLRVGSDRLGGLLRGNDLVRHERLLCGARRVRNPPPQVKRAAPP